MNIVLLGQHIGGSLSPFLHNHLFGQHRLPFAYSLFPVAAAELPDALAMMKQGGYAGANVTSPHKELLFTMMDELDPLAERVRAVNTVLFRDGKAIGFNTDVAGFRWALAAVDKLPGSNQPFTAAVLGTGGAARAAIHVLLAFANLRQLTMYSRSQQRAASEAAYWNDARVIPAQLGSIATADLLINATPVGLPVHLSSDLTSNTPSPADTHIGSGSPLFGDSDIGSDSSLFGDSDIGSGSSLFGDTHIGSGSSLFGDSDIGSGSPLFGDSDIGSGSPLPPGEGRGGEGTHGFFYDMIYRPTITPLVAAANRAGIPATNGLRMFAGQAAESFRLWTGITVDPAELHNLLQHHLKHQ
ncbi:MAG: shikimate dehydrogenase [Armatimonadetes bacterium]|nr:shikimate dehydrogenase [Armatimonadota bacterium]